MGFLSYPRKSVFYWCWIFAWKTSTTSWSLSQPLTTSPHRGRNGLFDWKIWKEKAYEWLRHASEFHSCCVIFQHVPHLLNATHEFSRGESPHLLTAPWNKGLSQSLFLNISLSPPHFTFSPPYIPFMSSLKLLHCFFLSFPFSPSSFCLTCFSFNLEV